MRLRGSSLRTTLCPFLLAALAYPASGHSDSPAEEPAVAVADGQAITCPEWRRFAGAAVRDPEAARRSLERLGTEIALARQAETLGLDRQTDVATAIESAEATVLVDALRDSLAPEAVQPSRTREFYDANPGRFETPERLATRLLLLEVAAGASEEEVLATRHRIVELRHQILAGADFGALARQHSDAENAARGGAVRASPRGTLLPAYEAAAWELEPDEVSEPVRLPDGWALIRAEARFAPRRRSFDEAREGIERRLHRELEQRNLEAALAEARSRWPTRPTGDPFAAPWSVTLEGRSLGLAELGLGSRPPRLRELIERRLDDLRLRRLARHRGLPDLPEVAERLDAARRSVLASALLDREVGQRIEPPPHDDLVARYERRRQALRSPELRTFEAIVIPGEPGRMREALDRAEALRQRWTAQDAPPVPYQPEIWGPLPRTLLGNHTSPLLARVAFELEPYVPAEPIRLEHYDERIMNYVPEGYVVLRPTAIEPGETPSLEEALPRIAREARRRERRDLRRALREEALRNVVVDAEALERCRHLPEPAPGPAPLGP